MTRQRRRSASAAPNLSQLVNERIDLSPEMALKLEAAFGLERVGRVLRVWEQHSIEPRQPRTLRRRLQEAGLALTRVETFTILNCELHTDTYSHGVIDFIAAFVSSRGELEADEVQAWRDELHELNREGHYFFSLNRYVFELAKH